MNPSHLHILQHSLGVDKYARGSRYRNRFITEPSSVDGVLCQELVAHGLMKDHGPQSIAGGMTFYSVTHEGEKEMEQHSEKPPKLSRSAQRYRSWLKADCGISFGEYLKLKPSDYA